MYFDLNVIKAADALDQESLEEEISKFSDILQLSINEASFSYGTQEMIPLISLQSKNKS